MLCLLIPTGVFSVRHDIDSDSEWTDLGGGAAAAVSDRYLLPHATGSSSAFNSIKRSLERSLDVLTCDVNAIEAGEGVLDTLRERADYCVRCMESYHKQGYIAALLLDAMRRCASGINNTQDIRVAQGYIEDMRQVTERALNELHSTTVPPQQAHLASPPLPPPPVSMSTGEEFAYSPRSALSADFALPQAGTVCYGPWIDSRVPGPVAPVHSSASSSVFQTHRRQPDADTVSFCHSAAGGIIGAIRQSASLPPQARIASVSNAIARFVGFLKRDQDDEEKRLFAGQVIDALSMLHDPNTPYHEQDFPGVMRRITDMHAALADSVQSLIVYLEGEFDAYLSNQRAAAAFS